MISFESDYTNGAHPKILEALLRSNEETVPGYGNDPFCDSAKEKIRAAIKRPDADVFFISGGTQANAVVISAMLRGYEAAVAAVTGHINAHEAGAVEYTGHKILPIPQHKGKIAACELDSYMSDFYKQDNYDHCAIPGLVYISHPTEYGTIYSKKELSDIYSVCKKWELKLFIDGARLGYGIESRASDLDLPEIAGLCDVFYIGGTKVGALCGEAVVFPNGDAPKHFFTSIKQHGALLAKGRLMGVQFDALFTDGLYFECGRHAIDTAERLKAILKAKNIPFFEETVTNQQFVILENERMKELAKKVRFSFWEKYDDTHTVVRFATSWSTKESDLDYLESVL